MELSSVGSVTKLCPTLCNPMDCSMPGFPALHYLLEFVQTHVHWVGNAIQPFHPLSLPSFALDLFQHQRVFQGVGSSHQVARILEFQLQHQSVRWIFRVDFISDWLVWFPYWPRDPQESSPAPQFESISSLMFSFLYGLALTSIHHYWKNHSLDYTDLFSKMMSLFFKRLSRFVIAFLPRSKCLLILWQQSLSRVILEPKKIKFVTVSTFSPSICHDVMEFME